MTNREPGSSAGAPRRSPSSPHTGRRTRIDPGRWLLERQRLRLPPGARPPPPDRLVPIRSLIPSFIEKLQQTTHLHVEEIARLWPDVTGASIAAHTRPGGLEDGALIVFVDHSIWLSEIQRYHAKSVLRRIQAAYPQGHIRRLVFRLHSD